MRKAIAVASVRLATPSLPFFASPTRLIHESHPEIKVLVLIARQFGLTEVTIKKHLSAVFRCLGVAYRSEAVALAMQKHVIKPRDYLSETRTGVLAGSRVSSSILSSGEKDILFSARNERSFAGVS